jgi:hypothetical protein
VPKTTSPAIGRTIARVAETGFRGGLLFVIVGAVLVMKALKAMTERTQREMGQTIDDIQYRSRRNI